MGNQYNRDSKFWFEPGSESNILAKDGLPKMTKTGKGKNRENVT